MGTDFAIDAGNTTVKIGVFRGLMLEEHFSFSRNFHSEIARVIDLFGMPEKCIVANVGLPEHTLDDVLKPLSSSRIIHLRPGMLLPVKIRYKTPETLGTDRIANACAAVSLFPETNCLVVDVGTCLKFDLVTKSGEYLGGSISPGLYMRYKSLSHFTKQLPLYKPAPEYPEYIGQSTEASIRSGVENGMIAELNGMIEYYQQSFDNLKVILTWGYHSKFERKVKSPIFVAPNLTLSGLKAILDCNQ